MRFQLEGDRLAYPGHTLEGNGQGAYDGRRAGNTGHIGAGLNFKRVQCLIERADHGLGAILPVLTGGPTRLEVQHLRQFLTCFDDGNAYFIADKLYGADLCFYKHDFPSFLPIQVRPYRLLFIRGPVRPVSQPPPCPY